MNGLAKETIEQYLVSEIDGTPEKVGRIPAIVQEIAERTSDDTIDRVRGDGNCLIRAILRYMRKHTPQILTNVLITLFEMADKNINFPTFNNDRHAEDAYDDVIVDMVRKLIERRWDYKGDPLYHMDNGSIDGLAIHMVMRLLGVGNLQIYQAFQNNKQIKESIGWRDINLGQREKSFHTDIQGITIILLTLNGCHYTAII